MEKTSPIDPYIGAEGYFDGTDVSLLLQAGGPKRFVSERREIEEIYGPIYGPAPKEDRGFRPTLEFLQKLGVAS